MFTKSTLLLIVCATLNWNLNDCSNLTSFVTFGEKWCLNDASQLIFLNNLDKKVDLLANNVANMLKNFKEELLLELKRTFHVSTLGSGRNCTIKNRRFPEYFYPAVAGYDKDSERRRVFTWIPGSVDNQCLWNLERFTGKKESKTKYKIQSVSYGEYLFAGGDHLKYDEQRREIFTWKPKTSCEAQCYWDIQSIKQDAGTTTEQYFTIRNTDYGEYLFAAAVGLYDNDRRRAFTWKFDPENDVQSDLASHWIIKCE